MPNVIVNLGATPITIDGNSDLARFADQQLPSIIFNIAQSDLVKFSNKPLSELPSDATPPLSAALKVTQDAKWKVGGSGDLTIGFNANATGSVSVKKAGDLFSFAVSDNHKEDVKITVPEGHAVVIINLKVSLGINAGAKFSHGAFGVSGGISAGISFNLTNYKTFPLTTKVSEAVKAAFDRFVLPFKADGVEAVLHHNDYVEYEFIGNLGLTFGLTYGLTSLLLGGRSLGEIEQSLTTGAAKAVVGVKPSLEAGAKFGINYQYTDAFRLVVGRQINAQANTDKLSLFVSKMDKSSLGISASVGLTVSLGASFDIKLRLDEIIDNAAKQLFGGMPENTPLEKAAKAAAIQAFKDNLKKEEHKRELEKYVKDANEQVGNLLKKFDDQKLELQVLHERIKTNTAIFNYEFDLKTPGGIAQGYKLAMEGNFQEALKQPGVSLRPGSYIENLFIRRTTIGFQFFDLFHFQNVTEYFRKMSVVYAGGGIFKLRYLTGVKYEDGFVGHSRAAEIYFSADATTLDFQNVADVDVKLNFILTDNANRRAARQTLGILQFLGASAPLQRLITRLRETLESDPSLNVKVSCAFDKKIYGKLSSDDFNGDEPHPLPHPSDARNWAAFVRAVNDIAVGGGYKQQGFPDLVEPFGNWVLYNRTANDSGTKPPNRRLAGNPDTDSKWPSDWHNVGLFDRRFIRIYLNAGRSFMNLADDLKHLAIEQENIHTEEQYQRLLKSLNDMIKDGQSNDIQVWFAKPSLLALLRLLTGNVANVKGPEEGKEIGEIFELSFDMVG